MGSRIMHLIIAKMVSEKLGIPNTQNFLLGGIAPDATLTRDRKNISHFYEGKLDDDTRCVNYKKFIEKYHEVIQNEFLLGYLTHLISDDVWMKNIYYKNNFKNRLDKDPSLLERWHNDFRKLNGKLIEEFKCGDLKDKLHESNLQLNDVCEIISGDLKSFREETLNDFIYTKEDLEKELQVYNLNEIINYIDTASTAAYEVCSAIIIQRKLQ
ncbi:zinc dependent phospholipase C family protein [Paenisporosarcina sp. TG20]|uniref:zinc dependent phospholipase C family protein n=1 Tax=Paenisporosarcina sp. TG20 TaxID=1211706 RepID=UPI0002FACD7C|nr:zinc dependent phospholipase C family protein [Paenisporosarcina sp. TG20]